VVLRTHSVVARRVVDIVSIVRELPFGATDEAALAIGAGVVKHVPFGRI
jgi:hypothetical protein